MSIGEGNLSDPQRLDALRATGLLDAAPSLDLDRLTRLATLALHVPVALISLVDADRQFFASQCGLPEPWATLRQTPLSHSFCQHVVASGEPLLIRDAREHPLVRDNLAIPDLGVIAYAGVPIVTPDGAVLGSLCAIDTRPRDWTPDYADLLRALSAQVTSELQLIDEARRLAADLRRQRDVEADRRALIRLNVHDIRTPLSALLMTLEVLPRLGPLNDRQKGYLDLGKRNGQTLMRLVNDLLDVGAVEHRGAESLNVAACPPDAAVAGAIEQVRELARAKSIELSHCAADGLPAASFDCDKVVRVLVNLLANAIKFTPEGGRVTVSAEIAREGAADVVRFTVTDTGIGIADPSRIFDEGVRLDITATTGESAGMGLTFCKRIVDAHGGRIWCETEFGKGSAFHSTLPVNPPAA
jgi:signal transduction histidine kinase